MKQVSLTDRFHGWLIRVLRPALEWLLWYPRLRSFTADATAVVLVHEIGRPICHLQFGPHETVSPGISFKARVAIYPEHSGTLEFVQDVILHREREPGTATHSAKECKSSRGARMLDEDDPYESKHIAGTQGREHSIETQDSPSHSLNPSECLRAYDRYRMFLTWRPDRFGGRVRVSLARIDWWWQGDALAVDVNSAQCVEGQKGWSLRSQPDRHGHTSAIPTLRRPVLTPNVRDVKNGPWHAC